MSASTLILTAYSGLTCLAFLLGYVVVLRQVYAAPSVRDVGAPTPEQFPSVSVVVAACNEEDDIESALRSLMDQNYPDLHVVAVDDRSTDGTGEIIDRLSSEYDALEAVHVDHLPEDWIGKPHALQRGYEATDGEWVLFTDADVHYEPGALRALVAVALHEDLDQMSCLPAVQTNGVLHEIAFNAWVLLTMGVQNLEGVRDPDSDDYFALGAFNLIRREIFDQTDGFSWLRMEIVDDMGTAKMIRDRGARQGFFYAFDDLRLEWYGSLQGMMDGLEKNSVAVVAQYNYLRGFLIPVLWGVLFFGPIVGLLSSSTLVQAVSAGTLLSSVPANVLAARRQQRPVWTFLFSIVGIWFPMYALIRSTYACYRRGGVSWRGTTYPVEKLRRYQRVTF